MAQDVCILVNAEDRARLAAIAGDRSRPHKHVLRARIILFAAERLAVLEVARRSGVSRWRWQRFAETGVDGLAIVVRPGRANTAASSWCSGIVREPLSGVDMVCPVAPETRFAAMSPRRVMDAFVRAHEAPAEAFGDHRSVLLPGPSVSAAELAQAVSRHGAGRKTGAIAWRPDPLIQRIMDGWPKAISAERAARLGFEPSQSVDEIVEEFIEDDLEAQIEMAASG